LFFAHKSWPGGSLEKSFTVSFNELCSGKKLLRDHACSNKEGESIRKSSVSCDAGSSVAGTYTTAFP